MSEPRAFFNGRFVEASQLSIPVYDMGFAMGVTVTEQLRTFGGQLFHIDDHMRRLFRSLALVGIDPKLSPAEMQAAAETLVAHNHPLLSPGDDLGLAIFVTPGVQRSLAAGLRGGPTVGMHTFPLDFGLWADKYEQGQKLVITPGRHMPASCWPPELKCRSRMHYYLADRDAIAVDPGARALLTDGDGLVTETATSNVLVYRKDVGLLTPPREKTLPGISLEAATELAAGLGLAVTQQDMSPDELLTADEVMLTSTPYCLLPAVQLNGTPIGDGAPGPIFREILAAWCSAVELDVVQQAKRFAESRAS